MTRQRLPNRRSSIAFNFECNGFEYISTASYFEDSAVAEIFLGNGKGGSGSDTTARDSAVVASIALQFGVSLGMNRRALLRYSQGRPSGPLGAALDKTAGESA